MDTIRYVCIFLLLFVINSCSGKTDEYQEFKELYGIAIESKEPKDCEAALESAYKAFENNRDFVAIKYAYDLMLNAEQFDMLHNMLHKLEKQYKLSKIGIRMLTAFVYYNEAKYDSLHFVLSPMRKKVENYHRPDKSIDSKKLYLFLMTEMLTDRREEARVLLDRLVSDGNISSSTLKRFEHNILQPGTKFLNPNNFLDLLLFKDEALNNE